MKNNKETTKEEFLDSMNELAKSYDESNISNKKNGSSTEQQSSDNVTESTPVRNINSLTDAEWRQLFEHEADLYD